MAPASQELFGVISNMSRHDISDDRWAVIEQLLPGRRGQHGGVAANTRLFVNAILYIAKTGIATEISRAISTIGMAKPPASTACGPTGTVRT